MKSHLASQAGLDPQKLKAVRGDCVAVRRRSSDRVEGEGFELAISFEREFTQLLEPNAAGEATFNRGFDERSSKTGW